MKKAFTLVELLIVMVIMGILSVLLFRSLGDMTRIAGRIEFEKILSNDLMTIHTTTNYLSEQYPHIDMARYSDPSSLDRGYTTGLYLISNNKDHTALLLFSGNGLRLNEHKGNNSDTWTTLIDERKALLTGGMFRILPIVYYTGSISSLSGDKVSADGFRIFGSLYPNTNISLSQKISLNVQHFVQLKQ